MDINWMIIVVIIGMSLASLIPRAIPFYLLKKKADHPVLLYLGKFLPPTIMMLLVLFCLQNVTLGSYPHGLPEFISIAVVVAVHLLFKNALLSIGSGTALFMYFVQANIFAVV